MSAGWAERVESGFVSRRPLPRVRSRRDCVLHECAVSPNPRAMCTSRGAAPSNAPALPAACAAVSRRSTPRVALCTIFGVGCKVRVRACGVSERARSVSGHACTVPGTSAVSPNTTCAVSGMRVQCRRTRLHYLRHAVRVVEHACTVPGTACRYRRTRPARSPAWRAVSPDTSALSAARRAVSANTPALSAARDAVSANTPALSAARDAVSANTPGLSPAHTVVWRNARPSPAARPVVSLAAPITSSNGGVACQAAQTKCRAAR